MRTELPNGTVTFLFTDIEGSTRLLHELGAGYADVLAEHHRRLRRAWRKHGGVEVDTAGDAFFVAFGDAGAAVAAAAAGQTELAGMRVRVRMGLHTGTPQLGETGYVGIDVHKAARIAAVAHGGQVLASESTRALVPETWRDLGVHRLKDLAAPERLFQLGTGDFPTLKTLHVTNLPAQPNPLIGRARELEDVVALIGEGNRLVTLTGAGGTGKTRLALQVAAGVLESFPDGVWFVSLGAVTDSSLVEPTIAGALGARGELPEELRTRRLLLVLDNLEQVVGAAAGLATLLAEAPHVQILATSRERLALSAEREYPVPTLSVEDAVALFTERACRLAPTFVAGEEVTEIVQRVDGLPLAVELAAVRIKVLTPRQIVDRLGSSLDLLTGGSRDSTARHQTLRATIGWSFELLSIEERGLFERLAVFAGSFDLDAAERVAGSTVDGLASLIDKSLLRRTGAGRYFMLETIRRFAVERFEASAAAAPVRRAHALHFARLAAELEPGLRDERQSDVLARLTLEQPNLRAALDTLAEADDPRPSGALAATCSYFWFLSGQLREGLSRLRGSYARLEGRDDPERGRVANGLVLLSFVAGDAETPAALAEEALTLCRRHDDVPGVLRALVGMQMTAAGSYESARRVGEELVALARGLGETWYVALGLCNMGVVERELGNLEQSRVLMLEALELAEQVGDVYLAAGCACNAAHAELLLGDALGAELRFRTALRLVASHSFPEMTIWCLDGLATIAARGANAELGARLLGAVEAIVASTSYDHPGTRIELDRTRAALTEALGPERAEALRGEGAAFEVEAIIDLALTGGPFGDVGSSATSST